MGWETFFDVRVFNPLAPSNRNMTPAAAYTGNMNRRRNDEQRIREIEHSSFTPLVLSATGGMGQEATNFYKRLSFKWDSPYAKTLCWMPPEFLFATLIHSGYKRCQIL
jgi:hypothetical protein